MLREIALALFTLALAAPPVPGTAAENSAPAPAARWSLALHGGAGVIPASLTEDQKRARLASLSGALEKGKAILAGGGRSLDAVEAVVRFLEDDPAFNAGRGAVFTHDGKHELDAAIMDGRDLACGSVAGLSSVKNPISLARRVMEKTPHVFLMGVGAEKFAAEQGVERAGPDYFFVQSRFDALQEELRKEKAAPPPAPEKDRDTVGAVALDRHGNLAAATSTGGMTNKRYGRVGDVPVIGAGTYANDRTCAVSATGHGEEFIRHTVAYDISALMEYAGLTVTKAAEKVIHEKLKPGDGGVIAVSRTGEIALVFNSEGMYRGLADSTGRFEVAIGR